MTDEGILGDPFGEVEMKHSMQGMSVAVAQFYRGLIDEGFSEEKAFGLAQSFLHGIMSQRPNV